MEACKPIEVRDEWASKPRMIQPYNTECALRSNVGQRCSFPNVKQRSAQRSPLCVISLFLFACALLARQVLSFFEKGHGHIRCWAAEDMLLYILFDFAFLVLPLNTFKQKNASLNFSSSIEYVAHCSTIWHWFMTLMALGALVAWERV